MWAVNNPHSARKPITSTAPAVMLNAAGSSQLEAELTACSLFIERPNRQESF